MKWNLKEEELIQHLCKCGCGRKVTRDKGKYKWFDFIKGHATKKYQFNRNRFNVVETEEDAYWLGFFFADGFVKDKKGTFGLHLAIKDLQHLEKFKKFMSSNQPIIIKDNFCRLEIADKDYLNVLHMYGLVQGKSKSIGFPEILIQYVNHFIRGIFDGDGWITYNKTQLTFGIIGNESIVADIQIKLIEECSLPFNKLLQDKRHKGNWVRSVVYGGNKHCQRIFDYLYKDASIFLERKRNKWEIHLKNYQTLN